MSRRMTIQRTCTRCNNTMFNWPNEVQARICLPTALIADATSFAMKHQASNNWGIKPSCADLQLTNLACAARDGFRRRAYLTVGNAAVVDELVFTGYGLGRQVAASIMPKFCGYGKPPTAWEVCDQPADRARLARTPWLDSDTAAAWTAECNASLADANGGEEGDEPFIGDAPASSGELASSFEGASYDHTVQAFLAACTPVSSQGEGYHDVRVPEPSPPEALAEAEAATAVEEQQRAYVEGGLLHSTTTAAAGDRPEIVEPPGLEGGVASGNRTARARFPLLTDRPNYLHSNNPTNLQQAHDLRNIGIGVHNPLVSEAKTRDALVEGLRTKVFTALRARRAMCDFESVRNSALPKKLSRADADRAELEAMNENLKSDVVGFDTVIKAFVKSEVSGKDKPRPIANHGDVRLYALAKVAYVFEHVLFDVFRDASIKGRGKCEAIEGILAKMSTMRDGARFVENDLTAFEFGISETLKQIEQELFAHIADLVGVEESGELLFERVVNDRDKTAIWKMSHRDSTGERKTVKIKLSQTMRESGDRVTSSGNFIQNLVAWFSFLVDPDHVDDALDTLVRFRGAKMFYVSPRDRTLIKNKGQSVRKKYLAMFAFEGDDTIGRIEEKVWADGDGPCPVNEFFARWGWKAKLVWKPLEGDSYVRFVGYEALIHNSRIEYDAGNVVMTPETKRLLTTKSWTATDVTPQELRTCIRIFVATLAEGFKRVEPMHAFLQAVYEDNGGGVDVSAEKVREYVLAMTGQLPDAGMKVSRAVTMPCFEGGEPEKWKRLLTASAGAFTDREWAEMCHIGTVNRHGADLATCVPASWRA